jgi:hypothetical protein
MSFLFCVLAQRDGFICHDGERFGKMEFNAQQGIRQLRLKEPNS